MPVTASVVEREIRVDARPETVFAYLVDADKMPLWMGAEPSSTRAQAGSTG